MTGNIRWVSLKLLVFTAVTIAVTTWLAAIIGNFALFSSPYQIEAEFTDATGLLKGDVVKAAGVTIGRVSDISINDGLALVTMDIDDDVELPSDLGAEIRFRNLIGQRMVTLVQGAAPIQTTSLAPGDNAAAQADLMEPGDLIPFSRTKPAFDLTALFNGLRPLIQSTSADDINVVTEALTEALDGRSQEIKDLLGNIAAISDTLASRDQELSLLLSNVNTVTDDLNARDQQLQGTLADIDEFLGDLAASRGDLAEAIVTLDDAARRLDRLVVRNGDDLELQFDNLAEILDVVEKRKKKLKGVVRRLPSFLVGVERVSNYGQWSNVYLVNVCKDDLGTCGSRAAQ
jgi:phospholipid/cholesterol/gamma-HCH transport system substrate-binding protein